MYVRGLPGARDHAPGSAGASNPSESLASPGLPAALDRRDDLRLRQPVHGPRLPLTAVLILQATAVEMGFLNALGTIPFLLFGLVVGVWVDRTPRRPILIAGDIGRGAFLLLIPLAWYFGFLSILVLYLVGFIVGTLTVFFDVAYQAYLPALVGRAQIVEANSRLEVSRSSSSVIGPALAGVAVQFFAAPLAIVIDAISFFGSALFIGQIQSKEPRQDPAGRRSMISEAIEGMSVVFRDRRLWSIAGCDRRRGDRGGPRQEIRPRSCDHRLVPRERPRRDPARRRDAGARDPLLIVGQVVWAVTTVVYNVNQVSLRQSIVPDRLQGRMNATMRFLVWGTLPIGALAGGFLGDAIGLRPAITIAVVGGMAAFLWVLLSPVRRLRQISDVPIAE